MPFLPKNFTSTMDYLKALEEERKKILVFERELPLSLQLVTQAIETCKQQQQQQMMMMIGSEEICTEGPVLEEFIPLRPSYSSSDEENNQKPTMLNGGATVNVADDQKPDWLRSVQLWNQQPEPKGDVLRKPIAVNAKKVGGAFHPFEREKVVMAAPAAVDVAAAPASSTTENNINGGSGSGGCAEEKDKEKEKEKEGHSLRKARRCWSPELHRRFLHALQQLGGSHAATPKQIRELMKVDGLTNDEVKSHLQKYRLHTRRPTATAVQSGNSINPQQPQIVLVGGIWMPPPEYSAAAASVAVASAGKSAADDSTGAQSNGIYAPAALLPSNLGPQQKQKRQQTTNRSPTGPLNSERRFNGDDDHSTADGEQTNSGSSATSSSSQTTTASPSLLSSSQ